MTPSIFHFPRRASHTAMAAALSLALAGCIGGAPVNRSLNSIHQPVVEHASLSMDVATGPAGLAPDEARRLADWFAAMDLRYGDRVALDDPAGGQATRAAVQALLAHYGLLLSPEAPVTAGYVNAGTARVIITRATASVPGCPDWSANSETNPRNATSSNYGCAVNSNIAAMVANPDDLLRGQPSTGVSSTTRNDKAINAYTTAQPTGTKELKGVSTTTGTGN